MHKRPAGELSAHPITARIDVLDAHRRREFERLRKQTWKAESSAPIDFCAERACERSASLHSWIERIDEVDVDRHVAFLIVHANRIRQTEAEKLDGRFET